MYSVVYAATSISRVRERGKRDGLSPRENLSRVGVCVCAHITCIYAPGLSAYHIGTGIITLGPLLLLRYIRARYRDFLILFFPRHTHTHAEGKGRVTALLENSWQVASGRSRVL